MKGVLLYGAPASGKDTVTRALVTLDPRFEHFPILKAGPGKREGYTLTTREDIARRPEVLWVLDRYGARYAVDRSDLEAATARAWPVVHCGSLDRLDAIRSAGLGEWLAICLWCPRNVAAQRLERRDPDDVAERLAVWDATPRVQLDLTIDTSQTSPTTAAHRIADAFTPDASAA